MATPSSRSVWSALVTWYSDDLPTMHTVDVPASTRLRNVASSSTLPLTRRVDPKATSVDVSSCSSVRARRKNSSSFGLAPGQPPSMKCTPRWSSCWAIRSLSSTVSETPSTCAPSRRVVSKISTAAGIRSDMLHPVLVPVDLAAHSLAVFLHDRLRHRARARHVTVVDGADRRDLGGGAAQEDLLGDVQVAAGDVVDPHVEAEI